LGVLVSRTITDITEIVLRAGVVARQGLIYRALAIPMELFTPIFAVSRVPGRTARMIEYLQNNRILRPRALHVGAFDKRYASIGARS
jgi:citrate synthase